MSQLINSAYEKQKTAFINYMIKTGKYICDLSFQATSINKFIYVLQKMQTYPCKLYV